MLTKIISFDSFLNIVFNDVIFCDMHEHLVSYIYYENMARCIKSTHASINESHGMHACVVINALVNANY